jgi:hypothetical protein
VIRVVNSKVLNAAERSFCRLFYWAGFYDDRKTINFFLSKLGMSPFMKLYQGQSVVDACVLGKQYDLLEYMVKDTRKGINIGLPDDKKYPVKFKIDDYMNLDYYWKSRQNKDQVGNNTLHLVFSVVDNEELRFKFVKLCIEESIGDINKRNCLGYLPCENLH